MQSDFYKKLSNNIKVEKSVISLLYTLYFKQISKKDIYLFLIISFLSFLLTLGLIFSDNTYSIVISLLNDSLTFSVGITGFLIAGLTLFFTMMNSETTYALLLTPNKETHNNMYQSALLSFIKPFISFIIVILFNFIFKIISPLLLKYLYCYFFLYHFLRFFSIYMFLLLLFISILELIFLVYNIYSFIMFFAKDCISKRSLSSQNTSFDKYLEFLEIKYMDSLKDEDEE